MPVVSKAGGQDGLEATRRDLDHLSIDANVFRSASSAATRLQSARGFLPASTISRSPLASLRNLANVTVLIGASKAQLALLAVAREAENPTAATPTVLRPEIEATAVAVQAVLCVSDFSRSQSVQSS
jgi:hypothetical protein